MVTVKSSTPTKTKEIACSKCTYLLEYTGEDVETRTVHDYGGGSEVFSWIVCPRCNQDVSVERWFL